MNYTNITETANKWGISDRRIRLLCSQSRIEGAYKVGRSWNIPIDAQKPIDLRLKNETNFKGLNNINLSEIDKLKNTLDSYRPLPKATLFSLQNDLRLNWIYNSNAIEGNTLTLKETKLALEGITVGGKTLIEHLEVNNHYDAITYVEHIISTKEELTEMIIREIHQLVLKGIDNENAGRYRKENVLISGAKHIPPNHIKVKEQMEKLIVMYNNDWQEHHPLVKASLLHGEFVKIHPFVDGNGRTARLLLNFSLMKDGFIPVIIDNEEKNRYYDALDKAHTTNNYNDFILLISYCLKDMMNRWLKIIKR